MPAASQKLEAKSQGPRAALMLLMIVTAYACRATPVPLAHAPALLQRPGHGRIPYAVGAAARTQRLLRHGETAGGVSCHPSDVQSCAVAHGANPGLRKWRGARSVPGSCLQTGIRTDADGKRVCP